MSAPQVISAGGVRAGKVARLAEIDRSNFEEWKQSPAGQSALGFGRVNSTGGRAAIDALKAEKAARDARR